MLALTGSVQKLAKIGLATYCVMICTLGFLNSSTWGQPELLKTRWLENNPGSVRARYYLIDSYFRGNQIDLLKSELENLKIEFPGVVAFDLIEVLAVKCSQELEIQFTSEQLHEYSSSKLDMRVIESIKSLAQVWSEGKCKNLSGEELLKLISAFIKNPRYQQFGIGMSFLFQGSADVYMSERNLEKVMEALDNAYEAFPFYEYRLHQALLLMSAGLYDQAQEFIDMSKNGGLPNKLAFFYRDYRAAEVQAVLDRMSSRP
ncbi:hypothetical protein NBRC116495_01500 [Aurantivibrio plasticivorans]